MIECQKFKRCFSFFSATWTFDPMKERKHKTIYRYVLYWEKIKIFFVSKCEQIFDIIELRQ